MGLLAPSVWQMVPDNFFLRELQADPLPEGVDYYALRGTYDAVSPADRSRMEGATNIEIPCGHAALATSAKVYHVIRDILLDNPLQNGDNKALSLETKP